MMNGEKERRWERTGEACASEVESRCFVHKLTEEQREAERRREKEVERKPSRQATSEHETRKQDLGGRERRQRERDVRETKGERRSRGHTLRTLTYKEGQSCRMRKDMAVAL